MKVELWEVAAILLSIVIVLFIALAAINSSIRCIKYDVYEMRHVYLDLFKDVHSNEIDMVFLNRELMDKIDELVDMNQTLCDIYKQIMGIEEEGDTKDETTETTNS